MKTSTFTWLTIALLAICTAVRGETATPVFTPDAEETVQLSVLRSDEKGETHFSTEKVQYNPWFSAGKRTRDQIVERFALYKLNRGMVLPNFYNAPRVQFILVLKGTLEIETTNGEKRHFPPGAMFLVTDTKMSGSRGHRSKVIGDEDVFTAVASLPADADLSWLFSH